MTGSFTLTQSEAVFTITSNTIQSTNCNPILRVIESGGVIMDEGSDYTVDETGVYPVFTMLRKGDFLV
jgi:hypothetical protein